MKLAVTTHLLDGIFDKNGEGPLYTSPITMPVQITTL